MVNKLAISHDTNVVIYKNCWEENVDLSEECIDK